jgi:adenine-specific DNA-methyltransferase
LASTPYLAYLRDRLTLARELLADTGSIFLQISDENLHRVRCVMDEVFGSNNCCGIIAFVKTSGITQKFLPDRFDHLIWFAKDKEKAKYRQVYLEKSVEGGTASNYSWVELKSSERRGMSRPEKERDVSLDDGAVLYKPDNITSQGNPLIPFEHFGKTYTQRWKTNPEGLKRLSEANRMHVAENSLQYVRYLSDFVAVPITKLWSDTATGSFTDEKLYIVQTGTKTIERCLLLTTDPGDLVFDPTCGSGTTAFVAEQCGRRWITCDSSRVALAIAKHRLMTAKFDYHQLRSVNAEDISRNPNGAWLTDPEGKVSGKATFKCKTVAHITLKSIARNISLDPIFTKYAPILAENLGKLNREVAKVGGALKEKLVEKLVHKHREFGANAVTDADMRRWLLPDTSAVFVRSFPAKKPFKGVTPKQVEVYRTAIPKGGWKEWEVPFDVDAEWPKPLQDALTAYRTTWRAKMDEVNACIAANAEMEELVDRPETVKGVVRVSGPFTVEGIRPEELNLGDEGLFDGSSHDGEEQTISNPVAVHHQNLQVYLDQMVRLIRQDGLTFLNNKRRRFAKVDSLFDVATGGFLHAEGSWEESPSPDVLDIAIGFGPQYGPVTALQVEELIHASKRHSELVVAGFSFDADATALIQEQSHPKLRIHQAYIRPDVNPGMAGLLKETPDSQLFTVFGTPEIEIKSHDEGSWVVHLKGVEVYDPIANTIASTGADKVAAWFLDSDFDGRCFCITQAFFPNQDSWEKIARALGSAADAEAFEAFNGTTSIPFTAGKYKRVAVKVIDPRGNEVMAVRALEA